MGTLITLFTVSFLALFTLIGLGTLSILEKLDQINNELKSMNDDQQ